MAKPGRRKVRDEIGLADRISVGVLAKAFPRKTIDAVIEAAGAREQRLRMLPAWLVVYYVLALALFMDMGGARVIRRLAGALSWAKPQTSVTMPSEEALSKARTRLGPEPLRLLFEKVAGPLAGPDVAGAFWRGLRVISLDGSTLDLQSTEANWERFGGPSTRNEQGHRLRGGFPQLRLVALAECGTRALIAAAIGPYGIGEKTLTGKLLTSLNAEMLVLADRNFPGYELWRDAVSTGASLLWRISSGFALPIQEVLADGSYLSQLNVPRTLGRAGAPNLPVRVIKYHMRDANDKVTDTFMLITTMLDPDNAPACELAELYHERWQIEAAFAAFKSELKGAQVVLRSKTPDGVEQECWALLCTYHAIRDAICAAASLTGHDPLRLSFVNALDAMRGPVGDQAAFPP